MLVLLLTGPSATGKSTIARYIREQTGFLLLNERAILHELAVKAGFDRVRHWWKERGTGELILCARKRTLELVREARSADGVIIDGCYDIQLPAALRCCFSEADIVVVHVSAPEDVRLRNMQSRLVSDAERARREIELIDRFKHEAGMTAVIAQAHFSICNTRAAQDAAQEILLHLQARKLLG